MINDIFLYMEETNTLQNESIEPRMTLEKPPERHRIGKIQATCMIVVALLFDGLQVILTPLLIGLLVNWIFSFIAWILFYIWMRLNDVGFLDTGVKKIITVLVSILIEIPPGINAFFGITFGIIILLVIVNSEDALYNKTHGKVDIRIT